MKRRNFIKGTAATITAILTACFTWLRPKKKPIQFKARTTYGTAVMDPEAIAQIQVVDDKKEWMAALAQLPPLKHSDINWNKVAEHINKIS